jgi:predicted RNA-binding protein associated with RNAse of E/G family
LGVREAAPEESAVVILRGSKKLAQRAHARKRISQRFGFALNRHEIHALVLQIQNGAAVSLGRQSCSRSHWMVTHEGTQMHAVYDNKRHVIVTVLSERGGDCVEA